MKQLLWLLTQPLRAFAALMRVIAGPPAVYEFSRADPRDRRNDLTEDSAEPKAGDAGSIIAVMKHALWPITLPFRAFEMLARLIVAPPVDANLSRDEARRERDLQIEALINRPPPPGGA
jgi:hypothetical protein